ncbi:MAG: ABC transporter ATP-binding protein [Longispora sp.]|nr:ABC transporter ATP-binding protein [Longispora sp. (in: high G+C Gram-positive bacteria)]
MNSLEVRGVHKRFGETIALDRVDLSVPAGALLAVLGPSGCGKTTLLRCLAGFTHVDAGVIEVSGRAVTGLPPERRRIAVVPQEGALFPHLSVAGNVNYGLDRADRRSGRVQEVLALVGLTGYESRMPHQLSGGQQQRVAVARALAPRPPLVLLDEPFSALDATLRSDLRRDVRAALRADRATALLVTHDQDEAMSMADIVAVMRDGRIVQTGLPGEVYRAPADTWVASFVGDAVLLPATVRAGLATTTLGLLPVSGPDTDDATVLIRPEHIEIGAQGVPAIVEREDFFGHDALLVLRLADGTVLAARILGSAPRRKVGERVALQVRGEARLLLSA